MKRSNSETEPMPRVAEELRRASERRDERSRFAWVRHPLRILTTALALACLVWPVTRPLGVVAVVAGATAGVITGERAARSRWKGWVVAAGMAVALALVVLASHAFVRFEWIAGALGPSLALSVALGLRFFGWSLLAVAALRAAAVRKRPLLFAELAACTAGIAYLFASHRGGNIARPLWLSDWAWRAGIEPSTLLLAVGASAFVVLALLLATEHGRRTSVVTWLLVPLVAAYMAHAIDVTRLARLPSDSERDRTMTAHGEPPRHPLDGEKVDAGGSGKDKGDDKKDAGGQGNDKGDDKKAAGSQGNEQGDDKKDTGGQGNDKGDDKKDTGGQGNDKGDDKKDAGGQGNDKGDDKKDAGGQGNEQGDPDDGGEGGSPPPPDEPPPLDAPPPPDSPQNQEPMAIVLLGDDYTPPAQMFYLRQESWSQFAENRLVPTTRPDADRDVPSEFPTRRIDVMDAPPPPLRKLIHATVAMVRTHKKPFALETPIAMDAAPNPDAKRFARAYRFEALAQQASYADLLSQKAGNPAWSDELREYYTRPAKDPRFAELAKTIVATLDPKKRDVPLFKALAVKLWMDKNLTYSTRHRHADVADPAADFLFGDRIGYCVHFAHVAVYLWRSLGLPARVGMGYAVNAESREGSAILVKSGDGHAWPELYLEGAGWIVLDIAPQKNLDPPAKPADKELQRKMAEMARQQPEDKPKNTTTPSFVPPKLRVPWRRIASILALLALLGFSVVKGWRRLVPTFASRRALPRVGYRAALDMLSELGVARTLGETREAFARRLATDLPTFEQMTAWHIADQFGDPRRPDVERPERDPAAWRAALRALARECAPRRRGYRAWLGRLNPASFLASK